MLKRLKALIDQSAWVLILPALLFLYLIDSSVARTLVEWTSYALVLSGVAIIISRITFPHIEIDELMLQVTRGDNRAAAIVVASIVFFVGIVFLSLVLWAKS